MSERTNVPNTGNVEDMNPEAVRVRQHQSRRILISAELAIFGVLLSGCGQTTPPTSDEVKADLQYLELDNVKTPKGDKVKCIMYATGTHGTQDSKSWFSLACDFAGVAQFPPMEGSTTTPQAPLTSPTILPTAAPLPGLSSLPSLPSRPPTSTSH